MPKMYRLSGFINRENVPEQSAKRLYVLFRDDGRDITITHTSTEHDRPLYRKPTEDEIAQRIYTYDDYVLTTASDGII